MSSASLIGRTLGERFRVIGFIGEGAMASVYRAVQVQEPRDVAVKVMHPHLTGDPTFVGRFRREAKAASQIRHPNTVQILDYGVDGRMLYIAMELLAGQDLFETLVVERRLGERRAVRILIQICDALIAAHEKGIVHRDLKPENIMLLPPDPSDPTAPRVKVLDFGIAKILERDKAPPPSDGSEPKTPTSMVNSVLTTVGMVVGTPAYMSPEQCRGEAVDARSDVYACGILLYQLIAGRLPFAGDNAMDLAVKHVRTEPPPIHTLLPEVNRDLERVILTALGKWPAQRQGSAAALKEQLEAILPQLTDAVLGGADVGAFTPVEPELRRRSMQELLDADTVSTLRSSTNDPSEHGIVPTLTSEKALLTLDAAAPQTPWMVDEPPTRPFLSSMRLGSGADLGNSADRAPPAPRAKPGFPEPAPTLTSLAVGRPRKPYVTASSIRPQAPVAGPSTWILIPLSLIVGIAVGVLAYLLAR